MADQDLAGVELADLRGGWDGDAKDHVGAPRNVGIDDLRPRLRVLGVGVAGGVAGAALDQHVDVLVALQRLDDVGNERDPALSLSGLFRDSDLHAARKVMRSG